MWAVQSWMKLLKILHLLFSTIFCPVSLLDHSMAVERQSWWVSTRLRSWCDYVMPPLMSKTWKRTWLATAAVRDIQTNFLDPDNTMCNKFRKKIIPLSRTYETLQPLVLSELRISLKYISLEAKKGFFFFHRQMWWSWVVFKVTIDNLSSITVSVSINKKGSKHTF